MRLPRGVVHYDAAVAGIFRGRYAAQVDGPFVVFLIGMRINRLARVSDWWPVAKAMPPMLDELYRHPEKGFLGGEAFYSLASRTTALVQYWTSFDKLDDFARSRDDLHLPAWREFNRRARASDAVGIWHETYLVEAGRYEAVYGNMPRFGLARAAHHVPAAGRLETARRRLGSDSEPAVETTY